MMNQTERQQEKERLLLVFKCAVYEMYELCTGVNDEEALNNDFDEEKFEYGEKEWKKELSVMESYLDDEDKLFEEIEAMEKRYGVS